MASRAGSEAIVADTEFVVWMPSGGNTRNEVGAPAEQPVDFLSATPHLPILPMLVPANLAVAPLQLHFSEPKNLRRETPREKNH